MRIDIGARQSGQAHRIASPASQISPAARWRPLGDLARPLPESASTVAGTTAARRLAADRSGKGPLPERSKTGTGGAGSVGTGNSRGAASDNGRKSKPISPGPKLC
jgi:hypothetical protein